MLLNIDGFLNLTIQILAHYLNSNIWMVIVWAIYWRDKYNYPLPEYNFNKSVIILYYS